MKRVKNLTENKVLINTFKKLKIKIHLNKNFLKNFSFYLSKYNGLILLKFFKKNKFKFSFFKKLYSNKILLKQGIFTYNKKPLLNTIIMFIN